MTGPVARTSVRRTVRLAVALVAGQAVLCAVIGWINLGTGHGRKPDVVPSAGPLAAGPLVIPPPVVAPPPPRPPTPSAERSALRKKTETPERPVALRRTAKPSPSHAVDPTTPPAKHAAPPVASANVVPSPAPGSAVQSPVKVLDVCDPVNARGLTADGVAVTCVRGEDGTLRWQIN